MLSVIGTAGYQFIEFQEAEKFNGKAVLLRHDVDADLSAALEMAKIEHTYGIKATYFLMLRSPLYNLLGRENFSIACEILKLGHAIGLHYDQGFDLQRGWSHQETQVGVENEVRWLASQLKTQIKAVSFHQPGPAVLQNEINTHPLINTYDRKRLADYQYFSDSNRCFLLENLLLENSAEINNSLPTKFQLLIHPMWWVYEDVETELVWNQAIQSNFNVMQRQLLLTERAYGVKRAVHFEYRSGDDVKKTVD